VPVPNPRSLVLASIAAATLVACAHRRTTPEGALPTAADAPAPAAVPRLGQAEEDSVREYSGWYIWRFEQSEFVACGAAANDSPWWVIPSNDALRERDSLAALVLPPGGQRAFVRVRGLAGPRTIAGHMGRSTRYFRIFAVKEMRPDTATCGRKA
jgi:hypothetical protein